MSSSNEIELDPKAPKVDGLTDAPALTGTAAIAESDMITQISAAIASGKLDAAAAQQLLIDRVLAEHFPGATNLEPLRIALTELLAGDPVLENLLER